MAKNEMKWLEVFITCAFALGCATTTSRPVATPDRRDAVIVVPGYYGTALLQRKTKQRVFISGSEILFGHAALSLQQETLHTPKGPALEPGEVLRAVPVVPGLYTADVYGKLIDDLAASGERQVVPFAYDWRADLVDSAQLLALAVARLKAQGVNQIDLVAHSMGGLIATYYLAYGAQDLQAARLDWRGAREVRRVIYYGVPFRGVFATFRNMLRGTCLSLNCRLFPAETVASFPACYQLTAFNTAVMVDREGHESPLAIGDLALWKTHHVGLLGGAHLQPEVRARRLEFTTVQLERGKLFRQRLSLEHGPEPPPSLKVMNVVGQGSPTLKGAFFENGRLIFDVDHPERMGLERRRLESDGDGTVTVSSAETPALLAPQTKVLRSRFAHEKLFLDPSVQTTARDFLRAD